VSNEISQSQEAIQRVVFKIFERWGEREDRLSLLISLIDNPTLSSKEERQLVQILVPIKNNSEDFDVKLQNISNIFDEYLNQKKQMLSLLTKGKLTNASDIKNILIEQYAPVTNEINTAYDETVIRGIVKAKKKIDKLILSKQFKLAEDFLNSSEFLSKDHEVISKQIAYLSFNHKRQQEFLDLLENNLFDKMATDQMASLWAKLDIPNKEMQELLESISAKVIDLIDNKSLHQAETIIKHILTNLHPFPEILHVSLLARREKVFNGMIHEIQKLVDSKKFEDASKFLAEFELSEWQSKDLAHKILQSSHAEEIKQEILQKINQNAFLDIYPLLADTIFSTEDSKEINEELTNSLKIKLDVDEIDSDQAKALICDEQFQLISARAGSGKTTTLINKVKLLKFLNRMNLSEYLFLVFNSQVRTEIAGEISKAFNTNTDEVKNSNVHTFHSFAGRVSASKLAGYNLVSGETQRNLYKQCFLNSLKDDVFNSLYKKYLSSIVTPNEDDLDKFDRSNFDDDKDYLIARSKARLLTLNNIHVKSLPEKLIGDFFFEHDLAYSYEPTIFIASENKIYRPDFYINHLSDREEKKIYIEFWGIWQDGSHDSQSAPFDVDKYKLERLKKLQYWEDNSSTYHLMELFMEDAYGNNINPHKDFNLFKENFYKILKNKLEEITGKKLNRLPEDKVMEKVSKVFESRILDSLSSYVQNVRNNQIQPDDLNLKINQFYEDLSNRAKAFLDLGFEFRKSIQQHKINTKVHEYVDSIDKAAIEIEVEANIELIKDKKYLFIDEFQDTNFGFMRIIQAIIKVNPKINVVCVGDDWQSINSFMGARTSIYHSLDRYFPSLERNEILTNYRSGSAIVNYGNKVMNGLGNPSKPFLNLGSVEYLDIFSVKDSRAFNIYIDSDKNKYDDGFKLQRYHKLLFNLIKFEINKSIFDHSNKSIYDIPSDAKLLILSRIKKINGESVEFSLMPIILNSLTKHFMSIGYKEDAQEISTRLNQLLAYSSIHAIKGGEANAVFLIEANVNNMPMRHPDRELSAIFCDNPRAADAEADAEERRLYYVAVTRAKESLYVVTSASEKSPFMTDKVFATLEKFEFDEVAT
jgi:DNA helicase-4